MTAPAREWFSASELAGAPGMPSTARRVKQRADSNAWRSRRRAGRGGGCEYHVAALPPATRAYLVSQSLPATPAAAEGVHEAHRQVIGERISEAAARRIRAEGLASSAASKASDRARIEARRALLLLADDYAAASKRPRREADAAFARAYTSGAVGVGEATRRAVPRVSAATLRRWRALLKTKGESALAGRYGNRAGSSKVDRAPDVRDFCLAMLHERPHASAKQIYRGLKARFDADLLPSKRRLHAWMRRWKRDHAELYCHITSPDAWRSRYQAASGNASEAVKALNQLWEMDSTPGDVLLADGHRHTVIGVIDIHSRRGKLQVSRTSRSTAIAALFRRAVIDWGVPDSVRTDEGSDYTSLHMRRVFDGLGSHHEICPPFTPEKKPFIERFLGTFTRDLVELLAGYIGHDVAERKSIEARRSFADRLMKRGEAPAELRLTPEEFQAFCDAWCEQVYGIEPHSGLGGKTPLEVAASWPHEIRHIGNERALDILLSEAPGDGQRTVTKKGIRIENALFDSPALGGYAGEQVRVLLDETDFGSIYVFDLDTGAFVCQAICPERTGISRKEIATHRRQKQRALISRARKELKSIARRVDTGNIVSEILAERAHAAGKLEYFPSAKTDHTTPELEAAAQAAAGKKPKARKLDDDEIAAQQRAAARLSSTTVHQLDETLDQRARRWFHVDQRISQGERVPQEDFEFWQGFKGTPEHRAYERMRQQLGRDRITKDTA